LQIGDQLLSRTGEIVRILNVESRVEETLVYNFDIDDFHTYAVGVREVLVHNNSAAGGFQYKGKVRDEVRDKNPPTMKTTHRYDSKEVKAVRKEFGIPKELKNDFDKFLQGVKGKGERLSRADLAQAAIDFKLFRGLK